jgi:hypothetical protein
MPSGSAPDETASDVCDGTQFIRARETLWRQLSDVTLVRTVDDPDVVELWGTAALLWMALAEPVTAGDVAADLAALTDAPLDVVARDVRTAIADLVRRGVVIRVEPS